MPSQKISAQLGKTGLCVWPNFLSLEALKETRNDLDEIQNSGGFTRAGTGQGSRNAIQNLRRDETHWLDRENANPVQSELWKKLDLLQLALIRNLFLAK